MPLFLFATKSFLMDVKFLVPFKDAFIKQVHEVRVWKYNSAK
ncbi:MAG: hypothetical protein ABTQ25_06465 [Nitrosomonas ureae]